MPEPPAHVRTTHEVVNQAKPLDDYDAFACNPALQEKVRCC